jgi:hypothetical protein
MVYCSKCGTQNSEGSIHCSNCGSPLIQTAQPRETRYERKTNRRQVRHSDGMGYIGLFVGVIIILIGLFSLLEVYGFDFPWWPIVMIIMGFFLISRWLIFKGKRARLG